jgi:DNA polymerase-1
MRLLLDADMLLFRAAAATEVEIQLAEDVWTRHSELPAAREWYWEKVEEMCGGLGIAVDDVWHCFTDASAFRRELYPDYKHNRKGKPKPIGFKQLRNEMLEEPAAFIFRQIEADDAIGIFATMPEVAEDPVAIASGDKDMMQVPGLHVWLGAEPYKQSKEAAERFTYEQYLTGDATDGVPGCPGIGAVTAKRIVESFDIAKPVDCWEEIVRTYEKKGKVVEPSETATQQARLVRILRHGEYDFNTHTVKLWNPPTH